LGLKQELTSPFQLASDRDWHDTYVILQGTQISTYRLKHPGPFSKSKTIGPGRLIKNFTLQHAEVGIAADFRKTLPTPKSPFASLIPAAARQKLFETDPQLFEPIREHAIRLRLETEQFLLCASSQEEMLDWVEKLCAAVDISQPLEDRSEPRYRSLPRRSRRQRLVDGVRVGNLDNLSSLEGGRMIIAEQERILRRLYPHLAGANSGEAREPIESLNGHSAADPEMEDFDPEDVRFPSARRTTSRSSESEERPSSSATTESSADPKSRPRHYHSQSQTLRYRRRCAPVLLADSPRVSDVVFSGGKRMRINTKERALVSFTPLPPRYDAHNFPRQKEPLPRIVESPAVKPVPVAIANERPTVLLRGTSDDSLLSSASDSDDIRSALASEPPSPTTRAKLDAARRLVDRSKTRTSHERTREDGLDTVALGVGLLV
jgi:hypothetical protein